MPADVVIRPAVRDDADGITDVHVAAWRAGYAHVFPETLLYADDFEATRRERWRGWRFGAGVRVAVAAVPTDGGDRVVGFAMFGPEPERARGFTGRGEVWAFYVHPDTWGTGVADRLLDHVSLRLRTEGFEVAVLWVLEDNPRARRFYERHGWICTGLTGDFHAARDVTAPEVEYRKELA